MKVQVRPKAKVKVDGVLAWKSAIFFCFLIGRRVTLAVGLTRMEKKLKKAINKKEMNNFIE